MYRIVYFRRTVAEFCNKVSSDVTNESYFSGSKWGTVYLKLADTNGEKDFVRLSEMSAFWKVWHFCLVFENFVTSRMY